MSCPSVFWFGLIWTNVRLATHWNEIQPVALLGRGRGPGYLFLLDFFQISTYTF